jgi:hypothetical protein
MPEAVKAVRSTGAVEQQAHQLLERPRLVEARRELVERGEAGHPGVAEVQQALGQRDRR